ncbi:putative bifunctional diguanylate cyclase/phosphodiesterase [Actinospica robiniae]|uniref:putative bifunctional diguanylate cyclase/phosphodiesterase n=1 Tax=Actinospica robiniae TaxID=304901 RepID=UPI0012F89D32|nr:GGDEF domain-containing phosphodiesterase [Actinospica robiniae]
MYAVLVAALIAALVLLPNHVGAAWAVFGTAAFAAMVVGALIHPSSFRIPLWLGAGAGASMLAAQLCVTAGVRPGPPDGITLIDLFAPLAAICACGYLFVTISRRVRGWDAGFLFDVCIIVGGATATIWLYLIAPYLSQGPMPLLARLAPGIYPTVCAVLLTLAAMLVKGVGRRRRGVVLTVTGVAGLVYSNLFMVVTRLNDLEAAGFWRHAALAGAGWMLFQACWAVAPLHVPGPRCPSAVGRWPRRPMSLRRLLALLVVVLANPIVLNIQISGGRVAPLGHFPVVGGLIFIAVIARLSFVGAEYMASVRRLNTLIEAHRQLSGAQSATELAQVTAEVAGRLLDGKGEASVALVTGGRLTSATWQEPSALTRFDPGRWRSMISEWRPLAGADEQAEGRPDRSEDRCAERPGDRQRFLVSQDVPFREGVGSATALACPIDTARSRDRGRPLGMIVVAGAVGRVTGAADPLVLLAAQAGENLERIGVTMRMARSHLRAMTASISDAILVVDEDGLVRYSNIAAEAMFGGKARRGMRLSDLVGLDYAQAVAASTHDANLQWALPGRDQIVDVAVDDRRGDPTVEGLVLTLRDVTKLHSLEKELRRRATHDQETGLENRLAFTSRLAQLRGGEGIAHAVLAVAIDDLPEIAEESGPSTAHRVVDEFARRLVGVFGLERPEVARIDATTLALLISGTPNLPPAEALLARVRTAGARPVAIADRAITISVSAGLADCPHDRPSEEALEDALLAMNTARRNSPRGTAVFSLDLRESSREQAELRAGLNEALLEGAFFLQYQPVVDFSTRAPLGAEALIRWQKPDGSRVRPDLFIPFAEQTGQIVPIGGWVLHRAVQDYRHWPQITRAAGDPRQLRVNVNVSPVQLREPDFLDQVRALLGETGLPPSSLVLEVTESGIVEQVETLVQARELGIGVAMDDFGTGYSSLSSLRRLPISTVKIDKAFVDGIATDSVQFALVEGIVRLAGELGLTTVAEGVETEEQHERLRAAGCQCGQGYLYSRPLGAAEFESWLLESG